MSLNLKNLFIEIAILNSPYQKPKYCDGCVLRLVMSCQFTEGGKIWNFNASEDTDVATFHKLDVVKGYFI
jgi:hypothetical protein